MSGPLLRLEWHVWFEVVDIFCVFRLLVTESLRPKIPKLTEVNHGLKNEHLGPTNHPNTRHVGGSTELNSPKGPDPRPYALRN